MQALNKLPETEKRLKIVAQLEQKAKQDAAKKQTAGSPNTGMYTTNNDNTGNQIDAKFYFNNSAALSQGFADFKKRWGTRPLADDWRRSQTSGMAAMQNTTATNAIAASSSTLKATDGADAINEQVNVILFTLPNTPDKLAQSNLRIANAYYEIGNYYREVAQDTAAAIGTFEELLVKFPNYENTAAVCYNLFRLYADLDSVKSASFKASILKNYPNSLYAKVILDPEFSQKQDEQVVALNRAYNQTFDEFAKKNYTNTLVCIMELKAQFGENKLSPQLAYLKTIAEGHQEELAPFETSLKNIVSTYPEDKLITPLVKNHLDFIEKNRKVLAAKLAVLTDKDPLVYALVEDDRAQNIMQINASSGEVKAYTNEMAVYNALDINENGSMVTLYGNTATPNEIYIASNNNSFQRITHLQDSFLAPLKKVWVKGISAIASDKNKVNGILYLPDSNSKKLPLILFIHGGPVAQDEYSFDITRQIYAAAGYAVAAVNYRGSSGRGANYTKTIYADWGNKEVKDIIGITNELIKQGIADSTKLAIAGWSYGGILTNYTIATDTRFKAAVSGAGSSLMLSFYGTDQYITQYEPELGKPWNNLKKWLDVSYPFFKVKEIKTPTLFMASQADFNVPVVGAEQMYQAFKSEGIPTQLIIYPNQNHGIRVPSYLVHRYNSHLNWFKTYLK